MYPELQKSGLPKHKFRTKLVFGSSLAPTTQAVLGPPNLSLGCKDSHINTLIC